MRVLGQAQIFCSKSTFYFGTFIIWRGYAGTEWRDTLAPGMTWAILLGLFSRKVLSCPLSLVAVPHHEAGWYVLSHHPKSHKQSMNACHYVNRTLLIFRRTWLPPTGRSRYSVWLSWGPSESFLSIVLLLISCKTVRCLPLQVLHVAFNLHWAAWCFHPHLQHLLFTLIQLVLSSLVNWVKLVHWLR